MSIFDYPEITVVDGMISGASVLSPDTPSFDSPSDFQNTIEAGIYRFAYDGNVYTIEFPTMRSVIDIVDTYSVGTEELTQNVGVYAITGTESVIVGTAISGYTRFLVSLSPKAIPNNGSGTIFSTLCTKLPQIGRAGYDTPTSEGTTITWFGDYIGIVVYDSRVTSDAAAIKAWLAAQYAAGTPVVVYYQLATPTTSTITPALVWEQPVYDRTAADIAEAKRLRAKIISSGYDSLTTAEKTAYETGLKGAENYTDFNRQKNNIACIAEVVADDLAYYPEQTTMDDILASDIEAAAGKEIAWLESINTIESNLTNIANSGASLPSGWQDSKTWVFGGSNPDYSDFNRWESNAKLIYEMAERMKIRFRPAGTFASGQANILPRRAV